MSGPIYYDTAGVSRTASMYHNPALFYVSTHVWNIYEGRPCKGENDTPHLQRSLIRISIYQVLYMYVPVLFFVSCPVAAFVATTVINSLSGIYTVQVTRGTTRMIPPPTPLLGIISISKLVFSTPPGNLQRPTHASTENISSCLHALAVVAASLRQQPQRHFHA